MKPKSTFKLQRRIRTVLYGDQPLSHAEIDLLHTNSMQRLYDLRQLGLTDRVYVDASHTRFSHVLGVMHEASKLLAAIRHNLLKQAKLPLRYTGCGSTEPTRGQFADELPRREPKVRLMAMLHDLTHAPFGHTLEDEIELTGEKHDEPARQAKAFLRLTCEWLILLWQETDHTRHAQQAGASVGVHLAWFEKEGLLQDDLSERAGFLEAVKHVGIILCHEDRRQDEGQSPLSLESSEIKDYLKHLSFAYRALFHLEVAHKAKPDAKFIPAREYPVDKLISDILSDREVAAPLSADDMFQPSRDVYLLDIIGNTICADLLDYAKRDAQNSGLRLTYDDDRIVENFTLVSHRWAEAGKGHPFHNSSIRTAVSLFSHKFRPDAIGELIGLLQTRYYVYERMLYHPTKCVAGATLGAAMQRIGWRRLPGYHRTFGDASFLVDIRQAAMLVRRLLASQDFAEERYDQRTADRIARLLPEMAEVSAVVTARVLLAELVPNQERSKELVSRLKLLARLRSVRPWFEEVGNRLAQGGPASAEWLTSLLAGQPSDRQGDLEWVTNLLFPRIQDLIKSIDSGIKLLNMLLSRRYPQRVFCLLGNNHAVEGAGIQFSSEEVAKVFRDPMTRFVAERTIERLSTLPEGTVVIHCPSEKGPVKLADVLVTHGTHRHQAQKLARIGKLRGLTEGILDAHEGLVVKQEEMYASTWRLSVSVGRPHDAKWRDLQGVIGQTLLDFLMDGDSTGELALRNDPMMVAELGFTRESDTGTTLAEPAESADRFTPVEHEILDALKNDTQIGPLLKEVQFFAAESRTAEQADKANLVISLIKNRLNSDVPLQTDGQRKLF